MVGGGTLDEKVVELDKEMHGWGVGDLRSWIVREDLEKLRDGLISGEELVLQARERRKEHKVGGIKLRDFRLVSDKSLADCIEAMIGCYLLKCGMEHSLNFMSRIGINLSSSSSLQEVMERQKSDQKVIMHSPQRDAFCNEQARSEKGKLSTLLSKLGANEIEKIIGSTFKEKLFLLQAFTHPSYGDNRLTNSYEKLEFLGEALLDYLVTCYIYTLDNVLENPPLNMKKQLLEMFPRVGSVVFSTAKHDTIEISLVQPSSPIPQLFTNQT